MAYPSDCLGEPQQVQSWKQTSIHTGFQLAKKSVNQGNKNFNFLFFFFLNLSKLMRNRLRSGLELTRKLWDGWIL